MYNKIASIILNSGKANGLSDVFVAQPDALKENLAGKIFILGEIGGKKTEGRKIFNFLIETLDDNYYNDEKLLFRGKIEGLKIENIFEAALAKTNKSLTDFLTNEKIRINPAATSLTLGVIYENKLHFSNFGRNRALLIYRRGEDFEVINVEAGAAEADSDPGAAEAAGAKTPKLFSSVISGEVPVGSYFIFTSEALPEYLSGKEMMNILTKLPPIAAAEQIKNVLARINTYIPFLGIIIKNTTGLAGPELREEEEENLSTHSSISSLNYTEQKTEQMLAPAGLINFSKISQGFKHLLKSWRYRPPKPSRKFYRPEDKPNQSVQSAQPALNLGTIKSLNLARADSFLIKDKIFFKKKSGWLGEKLRTIAGGLAGLFNPQHWSGFSAALKARVGGLNQKNRLLFVVLGAVLLIFISSLAITKWNHQRQLVQTNFNSLVASIEDKENLISSHLLYNDNEGAKAVLTDAAALLSSLPQKTKDQQVAYARLAEKLRADQEKIQKVVYVAAVKVNDLSGLGINSLVFAGGKIYGAADKFVYGLTPDSASSTKTEIAGANNLSNPHKDFNNDIIYYRDTANIAEFFLKTKASNLISTANLEVATGLTGFKIYNKKLYSVAKDKNQIYVYANKNGFSTKTDWLKDGADLSQAVDLAIDKDIYVLKADGAVLKFSLGKTVKYDAGALSPVMTGANKLIVGVNYLYVFEASSKRLAVLAKKDGHLVNQYIIDSQVPKDVTVDEAGRAAYFLDGETLYKIGLNQ